MDEVHVGLPILERFEASSSNNLDTSSDDSLDDESSQLDADWFLVAILALHLYVTLLDLLSCLGKIKYLSILLFL